MSDLPVRCWPLFSLLEPMRQLAGVVCDVVYPERCALCQVFPENIPWCSAGRGVKGLRSFDAPHLCQACWRLLSESEPVHRQWVTERGRAIPCLGAGPITGDLVKVVAAWKYHGLRGLAWPLADLLVQAVEGTRSIPRCARVVPVPLHGRRQRSRGFNQAALLAGILAKAWEGEFLPAMARRIRSTAQQAKIGEANQRATNLLGAFQAPTNRDHCDRPMILVDDIVTSGATCGHLIGTLEDAGWNVSLVVGLGVSPGKGENAHPQNTAEGLQVDTERPPF